MKTSCIKKQNIKSLFTHRLQEQSQHAHGTSQEHALAGDTGAWDSGTGEWLNCRGGGRSLGACSASNTRDGAGLGGQGGNSGDGRSGHRGHADKADGGSGTDTCGSGSCEGNLRNSPCARGVGDGSAWHRSGSSSTRGSRGRSQGDGGGDSGDNSWVTGDVATADTGEVGQSGGEFIRVAAPGLDTGDDGGGGVG